MVQKDINEVILRKQNGLLTPKNPQKNLHVLQNGVDFTFFYNNGIETLNHNYDWENVH